MLQDHEKIRGSTLTVAQMRARGDAYLAEAEAYEANPDGNHNWRGMSKKKSGPIGGDLGKWLRRCAASCFKSVELGTIQREHGDASGI